MMIWGRANERRSERKIAKTIDDDDGWAVRKDRRWARRGERSWAWGRATYRRRLLPGAGSPAANDRESDAVLNGLYVQCAALFRPPSPEVTCSSDKSREKKYGGRETEERQKNQRGEEEVEEEEGEEKEEEIEVRGAK